MNRICYHHWCALLLQSLMGTIAIETENMLSVNSVVDCSAHILYVVYCVGGGHGLNVSYSFSA